jgi:hypothetical protein
MHWAVHLIAALISVTIPLHVSAQDDILSGDWTTDCLPIGKNNRHGYISHIVIRDGSVEATSQLYAKNTCQTPTVKVRYTGRLVEGVAKDGYVDVSQEVGGITFTLNSDDVSAFYNKNSKDAGCGLADWRTNQAVSVAGRTCAPFSFAPAGSTIFDRAWLSGNQLRFGNFPSKWDAIDSTHRPTAPSETIFYRTGL